jgi:hypothetical protein
MQNIIQRVLRVKIISPFDMALLSICFSVYAVLRSITLTLMDLTVHQNLGLDQHNFNKATMCPKLLLDHI